MFNQAISNTTRHINHNRVNLSHYSVQSGFTLIELLVSLVLGLVLLSGVLTLFNQTQQSFRVNENFARIQENARFGFEVMSREIREAGSTPCGMRQAMASVIQTAGATPWYANWAAGPVRGFDNTEASADMAVFGALTGNRISGTDAIVVLRNLSDESTIRIVTNHDVATANAFTVQADPTSSYNQADLISVCDSKSGALLQVDAVTSSQIPYSVSGGNCSVDLLYAAGTPCPVPTPPTLPRAFAPGALITRYDPVFWYVGINDGGGRSLYRINIVSQLPPATIPPTIPLPSRATTVNTQEIIRSVKDMQIEYLTRNGFSVPPLATSFVQASNTIFSPANAAWTDSNPNQVVAVKITLTLESSERVSSTGTPLERKFVSVSSIRSRDISN